MENLHTTCLTPSVNNQKRNIYHWPETELSGSVMRVISQRIAMSKIRPNGQFAKFLKALDKGNVDFALRDNLNEFSTAEAWKQERLHWSQLPFTLDVLAALHPEKMEDATDQLLAWMSKQWQYDNHPEYRRRVDSAMRLQFYYSFAGVLRTLGMLLPPSTLLQALKKHQLCHMVLPVYINKNVFLCDLMVFMATQELQQVSAAFWYAGWEPVDIMQCDTALFGIQPKYNNTRVLYECKPQTTWLASLLEDNGFLANRTETISDESLTCLTPVHAYYKNGDVAFSRRCAINSLLTALDELSESYYIDTPDEHERRLMFTMQVLLEELTVFSWQSLIDTLAPVLYKSDTCDGISTDLGLRSSNKEKALKFLCKGFTLLLNTGDIHLLSDATWLINGFGDNFLDIEKSQNMGKLVVKVKTREQMSFAKELSAYGDIYVAMEGAENNVINLADLTR